MSGKIKRRFLFKNQENFDLTKTNTHLDIIEIYTCFSPETKYTMRDDTCQGGEISFRKTIKNENEKGINKEDFFIAIPESISFLAKKRLVVNNMNNVYFDFYDDGLSIIEVEFNTEEESKTIPKIIVTLQSEGDIVEITGDEEYSESVMSKENYSVIEKEYYVKYLLAIFPELKLWATRFNINIDSEKVIRDIKPVEVIPTNLYNHSNHAASLELYKTIKDGEKGKTKIHIEGITVNNPILTDEACI